MTLEKTDLAIIGGGPGGYVAAIRAAKNGLKVILIEKDNLGGICLNHGCIPSKVIIHAADLFHDIKNAGKLGIKAENVTLDYGKVIAWKERVVKKLTMGIEGLIKGNQIKHIKGTASFLNSNLLEVDTEKEKIQIETPKVIIATGASPLELPVMPFNGATILSSKQFLALDEIPDNLIVVGGGVIGLELGQAFGKFGSNVTVLEAMDSILPTIPDDIVEPLVKKLRKQKIKIHTGANVTGADINGDKIKVKATLSDKSQNEFEADKVLVTIGLKPNSSNIGLENTKVVTDERGYIKIDDSCKTTDQSIMAIGDITGEPLLAHKASAQGIVAAEVASGKSSSFFLEVVPAVVYTDPEIACVGLTEQDAEKIGRKVLVGKYPFAGHGRAVTMDKLDGFCKTIADAETFSLMGVQIVGANAGEIIGEAVLALQNGLRLENLGTVTHPHPTLSEGLAESAEAAIGKAIHLLVKE